MLRIQKIFAVFAALLLSANSVAAVTWDVSLWGKRRAFTENVEYLAKLVSQKKRKGNLSLISALWRAF